MDGSLEQLSREHTDIIMAADEASRSLKVLEMAELATRQNIAGLVILTGLELRNRHAFDWAEYALSIGLRMPEIRWPALFELSVVAALQERPSYSISLLSQLESEQALDAYRHMAFASQLQQLGQYEAAEARLERALQLDPSKTRECWALAQFYRYLQRFPAEDALRRSLALREAFTYLTPAQVADDILAHLEQKRPYSLVRINDGEGVYLHLSLGDDADFSMLYERNRRIFVEYTYGDDALLYDIDYLNVIKQFEDTILTASCLGADHSHSLPGEYKIGSARGVPCCFNITRKLEAYLEAGAFGEDRPALCTPYIHQNLLYEGHLERILQSQSRIGVVACHAALPTALAQRFGYSEVIFHQTPGEVLATGGREPEPYRIWHNRISEELTHVEPGTLYLVAAGLSGKWFCEVIKRAGGVALDIGSVADIWMKAPTRSFVAGVFEHHALA